jgi:hypothetical protein
MEFEVLAAVNIHVVMMCGVLRGIYQFLNSEQHSIKLILTL